MDDDDELGPFTRALAEHDPDAYPYCDLGLDRLREMQCVAGRSGDRFEFLRLHLHILSRLSPDDRIFVAMRLELTPRLLDQNDLGEWGVRNCTGASAYSLEWARWMGGDELDQLDIPELALWCGEQAGKLVAFLTESEAARWKVELLQAEAARMT